MLAPNLIVTVLLSFLGIACMILSAEFTVKKLLGLAHHFGISDTFVGLTVISIATSFPEIASHIIASVGILSGRLDYHIASSTVLGANIGSDVIQQTLVLGIVIFIVGTLTFSKRFLATSYAPMIGTTLLTLILGWDGTISRVDGIILLGTFIAYMIFLYKQESHVKHKLHKLKNSPLVDSLFALGGIIVLLVSSAFVLRFIEEIVLFTGVGGSLIGVLTMGVASAFPEMITAISGMRHGSQGISLGTLIGSNITNPLLAIGLGGVISTYFVPKPLVYWDLPMETITAALLLVWLLFNKRKIGRGGAMYLMGLYIVYVIVRISFFGVD